MQTQASWNDLALFAQVARAQALEPAAGAVSAATLSRRMRRLEATLGRRLFQHGKAGYRLTEDGRALLARVATMEEAAAKVSDWQRGGQAQTRVRISAGTWTSQILAAGLTRFWSPKAPWLPEFIRRNSLSDLARREVDIGIRNARPEQPWLAGRRTAMIDYGIYAKSPEITGWIGLTGNAAVTRSAEWMRQRHRGDIVTTANDPQLAMLLAEAGLGRVVLPCFIGDPNPRLQRVSEPIAELQSEEWLVSHQDARHEPPIRAALEALAAFLTSANR